MRVLLVTAHFRPHVGGVERFVDTLADGLAERGNEVTVLCCRTDPRTPDREPGNPRVIRVPGSTWAERRLGVPYPLPSPRALLRALQDELSRADVVHVQDALYATSVAALVLARRRRVPSLLTQHVAFVPQGRTALDLAQHAAVATVGRVARLADRVVALNADVAAWAERRFGVHAVATAPVGVAAPEPVDRAAARAELGLDADRFVVLFVGRDVPKKGVDVVLAAAHDSYEIVAVSDRPGPGPAHTRLVPFMPPDRLELYYAAADAFLLPSVAEGIPVSLQEAMARGLPVVTTYDDGYAGAFARDDVLVVERDSGSIREALRGLATDAALRRHLAARSRAVAATSFSYDAFVDAYERLYADLLNIST